MCCYLLYVIPVHEDIVKLVCQHGKMSSNGTDSNVTLNRSSNENNEHNEHYCCQQRGEIGTQNHCSGPGHSHCPCLWCFQIWPDITRKIAASLKLAQTVVTPRQKSFELLGDDIMLDSDLQPWILEVNMSPAM